MVLAETEQQSAGLESVLAKQGQASTEQEDVSEKPVKDEANTDAEAETTDEGEKKADEKAPESKIKPLSPELEAELNKRAQSLKDKESNSYREKREADTAHIRALEAKLRESQTAKELKAVDRLGKFLLSDEEKAGLTESEINDREEAVKETRLIAQKYAGVQEAAETADMLAKLLPSELIKPLGLDDPNPNIRARNQADAILGVIQYKKDEHDFLLLREHFSPKGDELRKQFEGILKGMAKFEKDESKLLFIKDQMQGVNIAPRKRPPAPSGDTGGEDLSKLSGREILHRAFSNKK